VKAKSIWQFAKKTRSDVCGYAALEKIKIWTRVLNRQRQLVASIYTLDKGRLQAYTFVQVLGFQHANWLCYKATWNICNLAGI
jgi:hypothetical protein